MAVEGLGGSIDILVNNAAAAIYQPLAEYPLRRLRLTYAVDVEAPFELMQAVLPGMRPRGRVGSSTYPAPWPGCGRVPRSLSAPGTAWPFTFRPRRR